MSRRFLFALSLFLALSLVPSSAFALDFQVKGVLYSTDLDGSRVGFVVSAYNQFDAACYALGKDPNTISTAVKQKLSDTNYGGRFYDYAESFFTQSGALEDVPTWVPAYVILISELGDLVLSDYQGVWYSTATSSLYDGAMADFVAILNGDGLGGGGSGAGDYHLFSVSAFANNSNPGDINSNSGYYWYLSNASFSDGDIVVGSGATRVSPYSRSRYYYPHGRMYVTLQTLRFANEYINEGYDVIFYFDLGSSLQGFIYGRNLAIDRIAASVLADHEVNVIVGDDRHIFTSSSSFYFSDVPFSVLAISDVPSFQTVTGTLAVTYYSDVFDSPFDVVVPPDGVWPEPITPVTPDPPELPDPSSPVLEPEPDVPTVTPTWPDITINVEPAPTGTTPQDYTPWLSSILTSINSMRGELLLEFDGLVDVVRNVFNAVLNLGNVMEEHCVHIRNKLEECVVSLENYMRSLVHWLADQLRYDSDVTGDSDIFGVLSSINSKLGGGTYEPNPLASELAYYGWNDDLWNRFLLGDNWETSVSGMTQDMGRLTTRFPFSIPWDVVALFRLFVHDPVTPVFDLPLYFSSDGYSTVHVDLSAWDSVAALVRPLVFVIFALKLALLSRDLLSGFVGGD